MTSQLRHHYLVSCKTASIDGRFYNFSVTRIVRMICAKNCEKMSRFIEVTAKILSVLFFWDTVYKISVDSVHLLYRTLVT